LHDEQRRATSTDLAVVGSMNSPVVGAAQDMLRYGEQLPAIMQSPGA
jgi:hypothetical protein